MARWLRTNQRQAPLVRTVRTRMSVSILEGAELEGSDPKRHNNVAEVVYPEAEYPLDHDVPE